MELLRKLEGGEKTPTELSEEMELTISSVTKHLKELEKAGLVVESGKKEGKTRSYLKYRLKDFVYFVASIDGEIEKKEVDLDERHKVWFRILSIPQPEFHRHLDKLWCEIQDDLEKIDGLMVYGSVAKGGAGEDSDVDLLIISEAEELKDEYGAKVVGGKMVMGKVFSQDELKENLEEGSNFALNALERGKILYDPGGFLRRMKHEYGG